MRKSFPTLRSACLLVLPLFLLFTMATVAAEDEEELRGRAGSVQELIDRNLEECEDPAERDALKRILFELFPEDLRRVESMMKREREEAGEQLERIIDQSWELLELRERDLAKYEEVVKLRQFNNQIQVLARKVAAAKGAEREKGAKLLENKLSEFFELKQANMKREVEQLKAHQNELERQIRRRQEQKTHMIERKLRDLTEGELDW